jgi:hypothetical protein
MVSVLTFSPPTSEYGVFRQLLVIQVLQYNYRYYIIVLLEGREDGKMTQLWLGGESPGDIPIPVNVYLVTQLNIDPDYLSQLKCVQQMDFVGDVLATLFRIFDPAAVLPSVKIHNFASLDQYPELIIYEGHIDLVSESINVSRRSGTSKET